ncbi:hypothetical protein L6V77_22670 [Myxococcota bacterium]|jgi:hypothetical protein|nr:hypothetical protein [Myxococcota bacterium]
MMNSRISMQRAPWLFSLLAAALIVAGCDKADEDASADGGPSASGGSGGGGEFVPGETVTVAVTAAEGGEVAAADGKGRLAIPPGALGADTTITLDVAAPVDGSATPVYDFGPDGTTFSTPATLAIAFDGTVPEGQKPVLAVYEAGAWVEIEGSSLAGGLVSGPVTHFSRFSVIFVDGEAIIHSECADVAAAFEACGGDPTGTWTVDRICSGDGSIGSDPFDGQCPGATAGIDLQIDGTITFADGKLTPRTTRTATITLYVPKSCIGGQPCALIADEEEGWTCEETAETCDCTKTDVDTDDETDVSDYVVEGNEIVQTQDGETKRLPFCVQDGRLTVSVPNDEPGKPTVYYSGTM